MQASSYPSPGTILSNSAEVTVKKNNLLTFYFKRKGMKKKDINKKLSAILYLAWINKNSTIFFVFIISLNILFFFFNKKEFRYHIFLILIYNLRSEKNVGYARFYSPTIFLDRTSRLPRLWPNKEQPYCWARWAQNLISRVGPAGLSYECLRITNDTILSQ